MNFNKFKNIQEILEVQEIREKKKIIYSVNAIRRRYYKEIKQHKIQKSSRKLITKKEKTTNSINLTNKIILNLLKVGKFKNKIKKLKHLKKNRKFKN